MGRLGGHAALARIEVVGEPTAAVLAAIGQSADVLHVGASRRSEVSETRDRSLWASLTDEAVAGLLAP